ncbi:hypothetical protein J7T55_011862 [Diaporthe amygdali]|uniref:uncharacterized protein n=1 Tax=Phomopsis amygdali TaxID=1214568 RepID=UPI0022FE6187|nr:uncharacterized protein J7T55_011862 [Diaporthe amygdali]KAJ0123397.1 hypothetical protein J7T55_011862 [Diaporthe amygdali]
MKFFITTYALVAAMATMATKLVADSSNYALTIELSANATEVLTANGLWAPNLTAFATEDYNIDGVDFTANSEKLNQSGLDVNELVHIRIDDKSIAVTPDDHDCGRCDTCLKLCRRMYVSTLLRRLPPHLSKLAFDGLLQAAFCYEQLVRKPSTGVLGYLNRLE